MMSTTQPKQTWHLVVADMLQRNEDGAAKYNRYLQTDCPDDMLQHAYEEALDLCVYLKTQIEKQKDQVEKPRTKKDYINELKRVSKLDNYNCCVPRRGEEDLQRDFVSSPWFGVRIR